MGVVRRIPIGVSLPIVNDTRSVTCILQGSTSIWTTQVRIILVPGCVFVILRLRVLGGVLRPVERDRLFPPYYL